MGAFSSVHQELTSHQVGGNTHPQEGLLGSLLACLQHPDALCSPTAPVSPAGNVCLLIQTNKS